MDGNVSDPRLFQILAVRGMLRMEIHGMTRRGGSALAWWKERYGFKGSRERVLEQVNALVEEIKDGRREWSPEGMKFMKCRHAGRCFLSVSGSPFPHEYCANCGWHKYRGVEYTREEWSKSFLEEGPCKEGRNGWFYLRRKNGEHPCGSDWTVACHYRQVGKIRDVARALLKQTPAADKVYWVTEAEFQLTDPEVTGVLIVSRD